MLAALLVLLVLAAVVVKVLTAGPEVVTGAMPGAFTGYAFDTCQAPSQRAMDTWRTRSPYWAVGIYIAGENRACARQPNLNSDWVAAQASGGWRLLPLSVGRQAPCNKGRWSRIAPSPAGGYAAARSQGDDEATGAANAAEDLGIAPGSTLWLDVEAFDASRSRCRAATLAYVAGWTGGLRDRGFRSGVYTSGASGVRMLEQARRDGRGRAGLPRQIWVGDWNHRHDTRFGYVSGDGWPADRVHQYAGPHTETYGGVKLPVDSNFLEVGGGTVARPERNACGDPNSYPTLRSGDSSAQVTVLQCLLRQRHRLNGRPTGTYTRATAGAVTAVQRAHRLPPTGTVDRGTWVALLSDGSRPLLKYGAGGDAVRRLQGALDAAQPGRVPVTGVFDASTGAGVRRYQHAHRLPVTGVVTGDVWRLLQSGR